MRLNEAEKILNQNGYELINEDLVSFIGSGSALVPVVVFFIYVLGGFGLFGSLWGIGKGIEKIFSIIVKRLTRRTKEERIVLEAFVEALEGLKKKENKYKFAEIIFDKLDLIRYCNNKYIRTMSQFVLLDTIYIDDEAKKLYQGKNEEEIQINIRKEMIIKFLNAMLPKGLKLDRKSISILTALIVQLGYYYEGSMGDNYIENEFSLDFNALIDFIVNNINHYDYKE